MHRISLVLLIFIATSCGNQTKDIPETSRKGTHVIPNGQGCFVTNEITLNDKKVGYMYRETADFEQDSGWRIFAGTETQAYIDNPENTRIFDLDVIVAADPAIAPYLELPAGTALARIEGTDQFQKVE